MGMYDEIKWKCPDCHRKNYAQSKSGECVMAAYPMTAVPTFVAMDANRHPLVCQCGSEFVFEVPKMVPTMVALKLKKVKREPK